MSKSFLQKINTLVQANLRNLGSQEKRPNWSKELEALHQQLNAAEAEEKNMLARQAALSEEALRWDAEADQLVTTGKEAQARYAIQQMNLAKQRLTMLNSALDEHYRAMSELMSRVNDLEARLEVAQRGEASEPLSEAIQQISKAVNIKVNIEEPVEQVEAIEQDLAVRRSRLAKPD